MGLLLWLAAGAAAFLFARIVPSRRPPRWWGELMLALGAAPVFGLAATWFDFGGWREPDWRAGLFALLGAFGAVGAKRLIAP